MESPCSQCLLTRHKPMKSKYTLNYFIKYFKSIPEDKWCIGEFINDQGQKCAYGHLGLGVTQFYHNPTPRAKALMDICFEAGRSSIAVATANNAYASELGDTPKKRVIAFLQSLKKSRKKK